LFGIFHDEKEKGKEKGREGWEMEEESTILSCTSKNLLFGFVVLTVHSPTTRHLEVTFYQPTKTNETTA
jgi:hypothetical protein